MYFFLMFILIFTSIVGNSYVIVYRNVKALPALLMSFLHSLP